jgi:hypothetical protein
MLCAYRVCNGSILYASTLSKFCRCNVTTLYELEVTCFFTSFMSLLITANLAFLVIKYGIFWPDV